MTKHNRNHWVDWRWAIAFGGYIGVLVIISVLAYHRLLPSALTQNDKLGHFVLFGLAGFLSHHSLRRRWIRLGPLPVPLGPFAVSLLVIGDEILQSLSPNRSSGIDDLIANWLGIVVFVIIGDWLIAQLNASSRAPNGSPSSVSSQGSSVSSSPPSAPHLPSGLPILCTPILNFLYRRTVLVLAILMMTGAIAAIWNMSDLSTRLIQAQALQHSQLYAKALLGARTLYSDHVVGRLESVHGISLQSQTSYDPREIPLPATFLIELNQRLADEKRMKVRLYSDYPFPWREKDGGVKDQFERDALDYLKQHANDTFTRIDSLNGRQVMRYAQADVMKPSCIGCHNSHPDSPRHNWQAGDVRGALEIVTPLDDFTAQTQGRLKSTFLTLIILSGLGLSGLTLVMGRLRQTSRELEQRVVERTAELQMANDQLSLEQEKSERLLLNILPETIAQRLKDSPHSIADGFSDVTILFADIVGFTQLAAELSPSKLVSLLNRIFSAFDTLTDRHGLEKIKTIGDAYMVAGGLPKRRLDHVEAIADLALDMNAALEKINRNSSVALSMRIGIHTGPVVAGVIGKKKFIYDLWGDTVNIASRMESHGLAGGIQVSEAVYQRLRHAYVLEARESIEVKGKGKLQTYLLRDRQNTQRQSSAGIYSKP